MEFIWFLAGTWVLVIALSYALDHDNKKLTKDFGKKED